ncbi:Sodium hydrogen exchanger [Perkinsus olseni]|nr:Sodium hydrogen exchanger [Perkinsus olseni]
MPNTACRAGEPDSFTAAGMARYFADQKGLDPHEGVRRFAPLEPSAEFRWRPSKKVLKVPGDGGTDRPIGIRRIDPVIHTVPKRAEKVHIRQTECRTEFDNVPRGRRIVIDEGRNAPHPRALRPAREASLEEVIGRRGRVRTVCEKRNGLRMAAEGDKLYKHPEFSDSFFKQGGLIAGAGFVRGSHPRTIPRNSVSWETFLPERPDLVGKKLPFREVERRAVQRQAEGSVQELWEWEQTILRDTPGANYEELSDDDIEGGGDS